MTKPEQVLEAYRAAVYAKDVDALLSLYDEDVCVFDMWGSWSYDGADAWRGMVTNWFASLGTERVVVALEDVQTTLADGLAVIRAFVTYTGVSAEGNTLRAMHNRLTCVLRQQGDGWKIVHEHSSAPADFETGRVILQR
ncbi:hypothetical protein Dcar01_03238 [Deinococcus carri]|uniref:SnoaL-like domain-containing protein n=1 Tax=Deinococcus carri TaxID=1211323 RepID=A0ABP9WAV0_9DEIO